MSMRVLKCLPLPISDCRLIVYSVLNEFMGNKGAQYSALSDLRFYPIRLFANFCM